MTLHESAKSGISLQGGIDMSKPIKVGTVGLGRIGMDAHRDCFIPWAGNPERFLTEGSITAAEH